jgi:transcriptional regulator with PAS, ATPase and Fis domain
VLSRGGSFLIPESDLDEARLVRQRISQGEIIQNVPCRRLRRDGRVVELGFTGLPIYDRQDQAVGVVEILTPRHNQGPPVAPPKKPPVKDVAISATDGIVGTHASMRQLVRLTHRVAQSDASVLILGESGVGKEVFAQALHKRSRRATGAFVAVNCAAIPKDLIESELFGHEPGAFTGATRQRKGLLEQANGGTIFLDEIGDLPLEVQVKLLRVLQERTIRRLGGSEEIRLELRFVAATHQPLEQLVGQGRFREDLYYRLNVVSLKVPPLRERKSDIPQLARFALQQIAARLGMPVPRLGSEAVKQLMDYPWPGNVRELFNLLERICALSDREMIDAAQVDAGLEMRQTVVRQIYRDDEIRLRLDEVERRHIDNILAEVQGNVKQAAAILGVSRETVYAKIKKYGLAR